ncbi:MAG: hypothetical protein AAGA33_06670 [Pseudomonadota bacterium]
MPHLMRPVAGDKAGTIWPALAFGEGLLLNLADTLSPPPVPPQPWSVG